MKYVKKDEPRRDIVQVSDCQGDRVYGMFQVATPYRLVQVERDKFHWAPDVDTLYGPFGLTCYKSIASALNHAIDCGCTIMMFENAIEYAKWRIQF